jgi:hypothetical protein
MSGSRNQRIAGWIVSGLVSLFLIGPSAMGKFVEWEGKEKMFEHLGYSAELIKQIGFVEIALALLFLVPRASFIAAVLLTGYLGGAVATHVRVGDAFFFPIVVGVVMWIGLALRRPAIWQLAGGRDPETKALSTTASNS